MSKLYIESYIILKPWTSRVHTSDHIENWSSRSEVIAEKLKIFRILDKTGFSGFLTLAKHNFLTERAFATKFSQNVYFIIGILKAYIRPVIIFPIPVTMATTGIFRIMSLGKNSS